MHRCNFLILAIVLAMANADWAAYKAKHNKRYHPSVESHRNANYLATDGKITSHNARAAAGLESFTMEHNEFSDLNDTEKANLLGHTSNKNNQKLTAVESVELPLDRITLPASYDLRTSKCLPAIKSQGQCGDCYTFSATTPIEYQYCLKNGNVPVVFSEQQLTDCTYTGYDGCQGGNFYDVWSYLMINPNGLETTANYPWKAATKSGTCAFSTAKVPQAKVMSYTVVAKNATQMQAALVTYGPISVSLWANVSNIYNYKSGVYNIAGCYNDGYTTNHATSIVGYGVDSATNTPYWVMRNSWGTGWGISGYALWKRGVNMCNIESRPAYPNLML